MTALRKALELDPTMELAKNNLAYAMAQKARGGSAQK